FGRQSGTQIAVDTASVAGKTSGAVRGTMTVEQDLRQLLAGPGLSFHFTSANAVTVSALADLGTGALQIDPVQVQGAYVPPQAMIDNLPPAY
ncbi:hypothetical protein CVH10_20390, partial [Halomonas sp. ND22Bw]|uniref:STN domain-containing protein n=1 Tax=Halomonas sp. ND22Bw TaxID=2054178 RepID=UPI000D2D99C6